MHRFGVFLIYITAWELTGDPVVKLSNGREERCRAMTGKAVTGDGRLSSYDSPPVTAIHMPGILYNFVIEGMAITECNSFFQTEELGITNIPVFTPHPADDPDLLPFLVHFTQQTVMPGFGALRSMSSNKPNSRLSRWTS